MVARRSAAGERTRTNGQARALLLTGPDDLRTRFTRHTPAALVAGLASLRPRPGDVAGYAVRVALRELGRRAQFPAASPAAWTSWPSRWLPPAPRACLPCTGSGPAPPRCCSSPPGTIPGGSAPRRPGRTCAAPPRSPRHRGKSPATGTAPAVTARTVMPCGGSCSPGWARTRPPAPTPSAAPPKGNPRRRSSAA